MSQGNIYVLDAFLWLFTVMTARAREVRVWQIMLVALAGFYLAMTPMGYVVHDIVSTTALALFGVH